MASERHDQLCQCGHVRNAHGGEGACDRCYDEMGQTKEERIGKRPTFRPAAPSVPPAADSPTPGTDERCPVHPGCRHGGWDLGGAPQIQRESIEDALENDRCGICLSVEHFREDCPLTVLLRLGTTEPPAETQQDGERAAVARIASLYRDPDIARFAINDYRDWIAARPSADTETLRRVRALADEWRSEGRHGADAIALYAALDAR